MKSCVLVSASSLPRPITIRWSAVTAISFIRWLDTKTVRPSLASCFIRFLIHRMPSGSSPLTGSSRIRISGSPSRATAMPTRWPMPSEKPPVRLRATSVSPTRPRTWSTRDRGQALGLGQEEQVVVRAAAGVHGPGLQQRAHGAQRLGEVGVPLAVDRRGAGVRAIQAEDQPHRGGFACAIRPEEPGHPAWFHRKGQMVNGEFIPVTLGEVPCLNHLFPLETAWPTWLRRTPPQPKVSSNCAPPIFRACRAAAPAHGAHDAAACRGAGAPRRGGGHVPCCGV